MKPTNFESTSLLLLHKCLWICSIVVFLGGKTVGWSICMVIVLLQIGRVNCLLSQTQSLKTYSSSDFLSGWGIFYTLRVSQACQMEFGRGDGNPWELSRPTAVKRWLDFTHFFSSKLHVEENIFLLKNGEQLFWKYWMLSLDPPFQIMYLRSSVISH